MDVLTKAPADDVLYGDMDGNGQLNTMDALLLYGGVGGGRQLTEVQAAAADYTGDGAVNMMDALMLYKFVSGK